MVLSFIKTQFENAKKGFWSNYIRMFSSNFFSFFPYYLLVRKKDDSLFIHA